MSNGDWIETYAEPRLLIEDIPFCPQLLDRPRLPIGWKGLVLVARDDVEHLPCELNKPAGSSIGKCLGFAVDDLENKGCTLIKCRRV